MITGDRWIWSCSGSTFSVDITDVELLMHGIGWKVLHGLKILERV